MRYFFYTGGVVVLFAGFVVPVSAATVSLMSATRTLHVGEVVSVMVTDDTERQLVNAVESDVTFPSDMLEFVSGDTSHSVLTLWVEEPSIRDGHTIHFSGIAPGGFAESDANLVTLNFKVIHTGEAALTLSQTKNLLNDGAGTEATTVVQDFHFHSTDGQAAIALPVLDNELPEHFTPELVADPDLFDGASTLVFSTTDKGSGIDRYEIKEGEFGTYTRTTSPYRIKDQTLSTLISIKAIDHSGNERIELFYPQHWRPWYKQSQILGGIVVLCLLVLLMVFVVVRKFLVQGRSSR